VSLLLSDLSDLSRRVGFGRNLEYFLALPAATLACLPPLGDRQAAQTGRCLGAPIRLFWIALNERAVPHGEQGALVH